MKKKTILYSVAGVVVFLCILYLLGPEPDVPKYSLQIPRVPDSGIELEKYIQKQEAALPVKPDNEARIIWANDSLKEVTPYVIVYIHGFGSCSEEGNPVHRDMAKKFGCNLLLTRLSDHGLTDKNPMSALTVDRLWNSAIAYIAIARKLGKKVIIMSTSNGGTLALKMAAEFPDIYALLLYSPNVEVNNSHAWMLNNHWGLQIARKVFGGNEIVSKNQQPYYQKYWYGHYRIEAITQLQELTETAMVPSTFKKIKQPVLLLYYYKDQAHQDPVVKVSSMLTMFDQLSTPVQQKVKFPIPAAGNHVIASGRRSNDIFSVEKYTVQFMQRVLGMQPVF